MADYGMGPVNPVVSAGAKARARLGAIPSDITGGSEDDHLRTVAHLVDTVAFALAHAKRHMNSSFMASATGDKEAALFNRDHAVRHFHDAEEHLKKLADHIRRHPELAAEIDTLDGTKDSVEGVS
jgi:hypothetical protein